MITYRRLLDDLLSLGLPPGRDLLINCAMGRIGQIEGGARTLLRAIRDAVGPSTTVVVPTQTAHNSLTSRDYRAATAGMTPAQRARYEDSMPGFDPAGTPSYRMGALAEQVRRHPDALRSSHPQTSFAALGPAAADFVRVHALDCHLGDESPLGKLYQADAVSLLLGVEMDKCTVLHLAEYRAEPPRPIKSYSCFQNEQGIRRLVRFNAPDLDDSDFATLGADLLRQPWVSRGPVGRAQAIVVPVVPAVDRAVRWFATNRRPVTVARSGSAALTSSLG
jgi:aminoglycoside 3-N-acetyltransferase